jgi:glutamine cyclotransferase
MAHPGRGFTQGLIADGETVWESTGLYGQSALCRYPLGSDRPERRAALPAELFGEGICRSGDVIWQLTWRERVALRWDAGTLELTGRVPYNRQGWGICAADGYLVTSDGTSELVRRDLDLAPQGVIYVRMSGHRVLGLNDLAWSAGTIWANVAGTHYLAGIDPDSGEVTDIVDARPAAESHPGDPQAIMNGIAALPGLGGPGLGGPGPAEPVPGEPGRGEFLLTGKGWRSIRQVRLKPAREGSARRRLLAGLSH